jgi:hypothetical protein
MKKAYRSEISLPLQKVADVVTAPNNLAVSETLGIRENRYKRASPPAHIFPDEVENLKSDSDSKPNKPAIHHRSIP